MKFNTIQTWLKLALPAGFIGLVWVGNASKLTTFNVLPTSWESIVLPVDSPEYRFPSEEEKKSNIKLKDPANISSEKSYDPKTGQYDFNKKIGDRNIERPYSMGLEEYMNYDIDKAIQGYWRDKVAADNFAQSTGFKPSLNVQNKAFDRIFGGSSIDIRPQGSAELSFGLTTNKVDNPQLPEKQRKITTFDFDQKIQLNLIGNIGDKLKLSTNYNTEATFDFENQMKLDYTGYEDEIIKKIEAGNVSLPLKGSLITGSQSLFGIKTEMQFGRLRATTIFSQQKGQRSEVTVQGGAQTNDYEITADNYEGNKHFFLSHYFRDNYDKALESLPTVNSGVNITRIEVWVTNTNNTTTNVRNFVAFTDIGEDKNNVSPSLLGQISDAPGVEPDNAQNSLYAEMVNDPDIIGFSNATQKLEQKNYKSANHFEKIESARMLAPEMYTVNRKLGFISLNQSLNNDEVLAVSYEYTLNGKTYQVGNLSTDGINAPKALILKLLKSTITNPKNQLWDLMMKNVYSIGAFQVNKEKFLLQILYNDPTTGVDINFIPKAPLDKQSIIQTLSMDRLDVNGAQRPDGVFDFVDNAATEGGTINSRNGRIFFPVIEPFGSYLRKQFEAGGAPESVIQSVVYPQLYDSTKIAAQQLPELNRFKIKGTYQSSSGSDIALNALNIPKGSVVVTAGGVTLTENVDYTVDYNFGRVKIINTGLLESQTPIKVSLESNSLFSIQTKTLWGSRFDYAVNKDLTLGGTILRLSERPITPKVNVGDEPISNTIVGFDGNYQTEAPFLTRLVDKLPFYETKETSTISVSGEFAKLIPGHSKAIGEDGVSYIDDFEGSQSTIDIRSVNTWSIASTPQGQQDMFPEGNLTGDLRYGFQRARLSWYMIDPLFFRNNNLTPPNVTNDMKSNHLMREVLNNEVFPNRQQQNGVPPNIPTLDLAFYPNERGPYNYDSSLTADGLLTDPETRWAGMMRRLSTNDFEQANIEFIQFWVMDPFNEDSPNNTGGDLYFNLGNISEDILKDSRKSFENGLPKSATDNSTPTDTTVWGIVPSSQSIVNAFDNSTSSNKVQDIGLDGLSDEQERQFYQSFLTSIQGVVSPAAFNTISADPAADDYHYYRGDDYDNANFNILERYKKYTGLEGNSPTSTDSPQDYPTAATVIPSSEDVNQDNNLSESESYFQYRIKLNPNEMEIGRNYITDVYETVPSNIPNGATKPVKWYQFKVPVRSPQKSVNGIADFRSIRFMRMFMRGFNQPVVLRFARLELVRGEWRKYVNSIEEPAEGFPPNLDQETSFDISAVNIEENGNRTPIVYTLPPGINREQDQTSTNFRSLNEQSLVLKTCNLKDGEAKAAFRSVQFDVRSYKKLKMFIHAESSDEFNQLNYGDVSVFIRLGTDFEQNYYEYEIPVNITPFGTGDPESIWPESNNMEIEFDKLQNAKNNRNNAQFPLIQEYEIIDGGTRIRIKGNPNLSNIKTIMIGIRNPLRTKNPWAADDGVNKCVEVWVNELRLSDFDEQGGWAALARINAQMADLGSMSLAGNISTPGFGSIEKKVSERQRETIKQFDASSSIELGKFLPEKSGISLPMYVGYSETVSNPQFDPLSPDIEIKDAINELDKEEQKKRLKKSQNYTRRKSINFTNVRINKKDQKAKPHFYDVNNVSVSYAYGETYRRDINTEYNTSKTYRGSVNYSFSNNPKAIRPFAKNALFAKSALLKPLREFNFYLAPKQVTFSTSIDRGYTESQVRTNTEGTLPAIPQFMKSFNWNRVYGLNYDLTKSLKLRFDANNQALIKEPEGRVNRKYDDEYGNYDQFKDTVMQSLKDFGENTNYNHTMNVDYVVPINKFPGLDWITLNTNYKGSYEWMRAPFSQDSLGHTIQNSRDISVNGQFNMVTLYNKIPYFKKVNSRKGQNGVKSNPKFRGVSLAQMKGEKTEEDTLKKKKKGNDIHIMDNFAKLLMSVKNSSFSYVRGQGTLLPGYGEKTNIVGMDPNFNAPGIPFILGHQDNNYFRDAADRGWLEKQPNLNLPSSRTYSERITARASLEPVNGLRVDLTANRTETSNFSTFFRYVEDTLNPENSNWISQSPVQNGTYSTSVILWKTAFQKDDDDNRSEAFEAFRENRFTVSQRLAQRDGITERVDSIGGFYSGFSGESQEVVMPAFFAAYTGGSAEKSKLNIFDIVPLPGWRITFDGLSKIKKIKKYARTVIISHGYSSDMNTSYVTNLRAGDNEVTGQRNRNEINGNFIPDRQISTVTVTERFSPLINLDITWVNSLSTKVEIKRDRTIALSMANLNVNEVRGREFVIGLGYRFKGVALPFKIGARSVKNDLNLRADFTIRDNTTIIRKVVENENQLTNGRRIISIKTAADYSLSKNLTIRIYYDKQITKPQLSVPFPTSNSNAGFSLRYTLTN